MFFTLQQSTAALFDRMTRALPHFCILCQHAASSGICTDCRERHFPGHAIRCGNCAITLPDGMAAGLSCGACLKRPPAFDTVIVAADYVPPVDQLVQSLKFGSQLALAGAFAGLLHAAADKPLAGKMPRPDILTTVPLAPSRLAARGFNQSLEIAKPLARRMHVPLLPQLVERIRETDPQTGMPLKKRKNNMRNAFAVSPGRIPRIRGLHIGIVDDVLTTGATLEEMATVLKRAGAARISGLVFARTPS